VRRLKRTLFISDLHLDAARPEATARFHRFLEGALPGADALYILGDLFESWVGDDSLALDFPKAIAEDLSRTSRLAPVTSPELSLGRRCRRRRGRRAAVAR